jgi:HK97 gp10 family phage protein
MSVEVSLDVDGIEEFQRAMSKLDSGMQRHVHQYLASLAAEIKAEARRLVPVRTGYLKSTIYARIQEWVAQIGADAAYALFVELGTRHMRAQPYLWPAIQEYLPQLENTICQAIDAARAEAGV